MVKENPRTREDILKLIEKNNGTAKGLNLSECRLPVDIDLSNLDLSGIILDNAKLSECHLEDVNLTETDLRCANLERVHLERAKLYGANMEGVDLVGAHLEGVDLMYANLEKAYIMDAHLEGANLVYANLKEADLSNTHLEGVCIRYADITEAHLGEADWGNYKIGEEISGDFYNAQHRYRHLKMWYTNAGYYDIAGEFFFREMTAKRKGLKWWPNPLNRASSKLISMLCGYGERPSQVVISALVVIFGLAIAYVYGGMNLPYSIYFSAVSFTALGYGSWAYTPPSNWVQGLGAFESFIGVFMMALFLVTFIRKMTR